jgi:hypothetical protein
MSVSYEIPNFEHTDSGIVHSRPLGTKVGGLYQNVSWAEVAIQGVPIDTTMNLEVQDQIIGSNQMVSEILEECQDSSEDSEDSETPEVCIKTLGTTDYGKGTKPKHVKGIKPTYEHTGRPIPQNKTKKYQTKPRIKSKEHRVKHAKHLL